MIHKIDYWVEVENDDRTGEQFYNIRSALSKAKKLAAEYNEKVWVTKYRFDNKADCMQPADFDFPSYWVVEPNGKICEY